LKFTGITFVIYLTAFPSVTRFFKAPLSNFIWLYKIQSVDSNRVLDYANIWHSCNLNLNMEFNTRLVDWQCFLPPFIKLNGNCALLMT